jgi:hypothetical protein
MKTNFCAVLLLLVCTLRSEFATSQILTKDVAVEGKTQLSIPSGTTASIDITLTTQKVPAMEPKDPETILQSVGGLFGRDDELSPVISEIRLRWGKLPPKILAKSAYADLYAPDSIKVTIKGEHLLLVEINGGDGAHGYVAEIEVAPYGAISRRVRNRKSGYEESTQYRYSARLMQRSIDAVVNGIR